MPLFQFGRISVNIDIHLRLIDNNAVRYQEFAVIVHIFEAFQKGFCLYRMLSMLIFHKKVSLFGGVEAWKAATVVFLISRFVIFMCTYMAWSRFVINNAAYGKETHECLQHLSLCLRSWDQFDAKYFLGIAHDGYSGYSGYTGYNPLHPYAAAFFPLYPLLIHIVGFFLGGSLTADYASSLLVANLCFFLAIIVLGWKRLPLNYLVFAFALALFSLMYPWPGHALASAPRFLVVLFPVGVVLALWSRTHPSVGRLFQMVWATFFAINTMLFVLWSWVA